MKEPSEYLSKYREEMPEWLEDYTPGDYVAFATFLNGRIAYYPGCGTDFSFIEVVNKSQCVFSYLYVDYLQTKQDMQELLCKENTFEGYHSIGRVEWTERELHYSEERRFKYDFDYGSMVNSKVCMNKEERPYTFMEIFERNVDKDDSWGAKRFAVTYMFADGIIAYYQLFIRMMDRKSKPWIMLMHDHGFGGNYDKFGFGGLNEAIAKFYMLFPEFIICGQGTKVWRGYYEVDEVEPVNGGKLNGDRILMRRAHPQHNRAIKNNGGKFPVDIE